MTYPLEGIYTTRFLHFHLCKETFASQLNMCAGTIMDKLCIYTFVWDICIMKFTSLKGDMCIIWTFHICILVKNISIENEKSRLASHFVCIHRKSTSKSVVKSLSIAYQGTIFAYHIGKTDHGILSAQLGHNICILLKMRKDKRKKRGNGKKGSGIGHNIKK